jgi:hypothetical protein
MPIYPGHPVLPRTEREGEWVADAVIMPQSIPNTSVRPFHWIQSHRFNISLRGQAALINRKRDDDSMKILFLHGWHSVPGGKKPSYLIEHGHEVVNPSLDDDDFENALRTAQAEYDKHRPDVIVGSSRGGAVAMNIDAGSTPLVLLCPAWRRWGTAMTVKPGTIILHSESDDVIPIADSEELARNSNASLIEVGNDHRLADPEPLEAMVRACESKDDRA